MEAVGEGDELVAPREVLGESHRALDRLGTRVGEEALLERAGRDLRQQLGDLSRLGAVVDVGAAVDELVQLRLRRRDHLGVPVAGIHHRDAAEAVEVGLAALAVDSCAFCRLDFDRLESGHHAGDQLFVVEFLGFHDFNLSSLEWLEGWWGESREGFRLYLERARSRSSRASRQCRR